MGFQYFIVSIPIVSYCKIIGLPPLFPLYSLIPTFTLFFLLSVSYISQEDYFKIFHQQMYTDIMYHFFHQALHVGTDIGAGFISNGLLFCVVLCFIILFLAVFWVGKQAAGESYGNVKMPGNGLLRACHFLFLSQIPHRDTFVFIPYWWLHRLFNPQKRYLWLGVDLALKPLWEDAMHFRFETKI
ncbi:hypothetical protein L211DRAFT_116279 [Terfezia boudieri ATCC MYA-4762]|uniref:Mannosyltransferase n=1 Tax=Terfezia boudieri ATCC MYA-4762 TaxID=1051890 RepID=A0A3N4LQX8_9PEZI|nr:hypothetical protein L211DRAFT_116279 [Terfezia boudieri ATCC MYA-4762]